MRSNFIAISALCGFLGVAMGAFGAHGLKTVITAELLQVYKTAVDYQMWHALALGLIAIFQLQSPESALLKWAGWLMLIGIILFSGSLYLLSILNVRWLGIITPFGGVAFLLAWGAIAIFACQSAKQP